MHRPLFGKPIEFAPVLPLAALVLGALAAFSAGCGKSTSSVTPGTAASLTLRQALNTALPATVFVPANVDTTASLMVTLHLAGGLRGAGAAFMNGPQLWNVGNVWVRTTKLLVPAQLDSVLLAITNGTFGGNSLVLYSTIGGTSPADLRIPFDGAAYHVFHVSGAAPFSAFIDSVQSVADVNVESPADGDSVTRAGGLTVTWAGPTDAGVFVTATVIASTDSTVRAAATAVADPAQTAQVPAGQLTHLPAGAARVAVARYRLVYKTDGTQSVGFVTESITVKSVILK
jgi:hypothetical protein